MMIVKTIAPLGFQHPRVSYDLPRSRLQERRLRFGDTKPCFDQTALEHAVAKLIQRYKSIIPPTVHGPTASLNTKRERVMVFLKIMQALQKDFCPQNDEQAFQQMKTAFGAVENAAIMNANAQYDYVKKDGRRISHGLTRLEDQMIVEPEQRHCIRLVPSAVYGNIIRLGPFGSGSLHYIHTTKEDIFINTKGAIQIVRRKGQGDFWHYAKHDLQQNNVPLSLIKKLVIFDKLGADGLDVWGEPSRHTTDPKIVYIHKDWVIWLGGGVLSVPI